MAGEAEELAAGLLPWRVTSALIDTLKDYDDLSRVDEKSWKKYLYTLGTVALLSEGGGESSYRTARYVIYAPTMLFSSLISSADIQSTGHDRYKISKATGRAVVYLPWGRKVEVPMESVDYGGISIEWRKETKADKTALWYAGYLAMSVKAAEAVNAAVEEETSRFLRGQDITILRGDKDSELSFVVEHWGASATLKLRHGTYTLFSFKPLYGTTPAHDVLSTIAAAYRDGIITAPEGAQRLVDNFISAANSAAESVEELLPYVRMARHSEFMYRVGHFGQLPKDPARVPEDAKFGDFLALASVQLSDWVSARVLADLKWYEILLSVEVRPPILSAAVVMNYPPLPLVPLAGAFGSAKDKLVEAINDAVKRLQDYGFGDVRAFPKAVGDVFSKVGITIDDVRAAFLDGFPRLARLEGMLEKVETELAGTSDIMSYGITPVVPLSQVPRFAKVASGGRKESDNRKKEKEEDAEDKDLAPI